MGLLYNTDVAAVESLGPCSVWLRFADGTEGKVDLASELKDPAWEGDLERWHDPDFFDSVEVGGFGIVWGVRKGTEGSSEAISLSSDRLYGEVRGLSPVEMHPELYAVRVAEAQPLEKYRVRLRFADGVAGILDLADFAGRGVFKRWDRPGVWEGMRIKHDTLQWGSDDPGAVLDFCPEMSYSRASGISRDEMESYRFTGLRWSTLRGTEQVDRSPRLSSAAWGAL